jgi:hypothetical protein
MRAMCGAIITAGALIGLGLTALGIGTRYGGLPPTTAEGKTAVFYRFQDMDTALMYIVVTLTAVLLVGLATAFLGLAYHHERRHYERFGQDTTRPHAGAQV